MEDIIFIPTRSTDLPEDVRGFEMIDGIVWLSAAVPDPRRPSDEKRFKAIQDYVRGGGHLVVCQPPQRDAVAPIADWLPVDVLSIDPKQDLEPLKSMATGHLQQQEQENRAEASRESVRGRAPPVPEVNSDEPKKTRDSWRLPQGPFMFARAKAKPGAIVPQKMKWDDGTETPFIARRAFGMGCVSWVAHDLSDPAITNRAKSGWPYVWDDVLDYKHDLTIVDNDTPESVKQRYAQMASVELSNTLVDRMQLTAKSRTLISIAVVFFIAYWAIAGPGVYFYLLTRTRPQLSWFMFAFSAVAATLLTVLVVKLVVRGAPEMAHITVVRGGMGIPQVSVARFSLYIPRDGAQEITLPQVQPREISYITADARHPRQTAGDIEFPAQERYIVPIHDISEEGPVQITVPFRSTAKEFQARRVGATGGAIDGAARLRETDAGNVLEGTVTNGTGQRLRNIYLIFHDPLALGGADDVCYFAPTLEIQQTLDLRDFNFKLKKIGVRNEETSGDPTQNVRLRGIIGSGRFWAAKDAVWAQYWYRAANLTAAGGESRFDDLSRALPMMSLFQRLPPVPNGWRDANKNDVDRVDLLRRGGRYLDCSNVIAAGNLLVLAEADDDRGKSPPPLPFPLTVWGAKVEGKGVVYYQFGVPLERIPAPPATRPATTQSSATTRSTAPVKLEAN
jgi:hypothetical protein